MLLVHPEPLYQVKCIQPRLLTQRPSLRGKLLSANGRLVLTPLPQPRFLEANDGGGQGGAGMR